MCPLQERVIAMLKHLSRVYFVVFPQISWPRRCKGTLVAFVWLYSAVCSQMLPQIGFLNGCRVTLVAFV